MTGQPKAAAPCSLPGLGLDVRIGGVFWEGRAELGLLLPKSFQTWVCPEGSPALGRLRGVGMLWPE